MFKRLRAALSAFRSPDTTPTATDQPVIPHPDDYATNSAFYAAVKEAARQLAAEQATTANTTGNVTDEGTAVQARDIRSLSTGDRHEHHDEVHHHGGTVTNNAAPGSHVGAQMGDVSGGTFNVGPRTTQYVGHNEGTVFQADRVDGGVHMGRNTGVFNMGGHNTITGAAIGTGATVNHHGVTVNGDGSTVNTGNGDVNQTNNHY